MYRYFKVPTGATGPMGGAGGPFGTVIRRPLPKRILPPRRQSRAGLFNPVNFSPRNKFAGFAGADGSQIPADDGTPGSLVWPYDEGSRVTYNPAVDGTGGAGAAPVVGESLAPANLMPDGLAVAVPFGESDRPWYNPTTFAAVPIQQSFTAAALVAAIIPQMPFLSLNNQRNCLIIQNNSTATTAGDTTPVFYVGFNAQPVIGYSLGIAAGLGIVFDTICPRDSIYVAFSSFADAGASTVIQGTVIQGTYSP